MTSPTVIALFGFIGWTFALLLLMEISRAKLVLTKQVAANGFDPNNSNLSEFMQRLARAHANCIEGLPVFGGILLIALLLQQNSVTDGTALLFLLARISQSLIHLCSTSATAVTLRFTAFAVQMGLALYWMVLLTFAVW